jgi:hypothetical protein
MNEDWYINHYLCVRCGYAWTDAWDCMCNDRCPQCDIEMTPYASNDVVKRQYIDHRSVVLDL